MVIDDPSINQPVTSALYMDRSKPIGNSTGIDNRQALHTKIKNNPDEPIFVQSPEGTPVFDDSASGAVTTPGAPQILIDVIVDPAKTRFLSQVIVRCTFEGAFQIMAGGAQIGSGRTGPGYSGTMPYLPARPIAGGTEIQVVYLARSSAPVSYVEAFMQSTEILSS